MTSGELTVYTVGHSNQSVESFLKLLERHGITLLGDVRSFPSSRFNPQFNRGALERSLRERGIGYAFFGHQLGGRPKEAACYEGGQLKYSRVARMPFFRDGIERVMRAAGEHRVAILCAEKEPLACHRTLLVGHHLVRRGVVVRHILADGGIEAHEQTMERFLVSMKLPTEDLVQSREELIDEALRIREEGTGPVGSARRVLSMFDLGGC